jgi:hypothetical protein
MSASVYALGTENFDSRSPKPIPHVLSLSTFVDDIGVAVPGHSSIRRARLHTETQVINLEYARNLLAAAVAPLTIEWDEQLRFLDFQIDLQAVERYASDTSITLKCKVAFRDSSAYPPYDKTYGYQR